MKIKVNRLNKDDGSLIFEIVVTEPHLSPIFGEEERQMMDMLQKVKNDIDMTISPNNIVRIEVEAGIHLSKEKVFIEVLENLKFAIKNQLEKKFNPICQEIYNWIYDNQIGVLKTWMSEFDPQRSKYYFDNDKNIENDFYDDEDSGEYDN